MGNAAQLIPYPLPSITTAVSGTATTTLRDLPKTLMGRIAHLAGVSFEVSFAVTSGLTMSSLAPSPHEIQNVVTRLEISDGSMNRFVGSFQSLRFREMLENQGRNLTPDPDAIATTEAAAFTRYWTPGPANFAGPSDFVIPCGALENGEIRYGFGALTDIHANCTAAIATITPVAWIMLLDEVRIPPAYEWNQWVAGASDINLTGRALYAHLALANDTAFAAITALDFANTTVSVGTGDVVPNVHAAILGYAYFAQQKTGSLSFITGDVRASTSDAAKNINAGTPTALEVAVKRVSPVLWTPPEAKITKMVALAESVCRVKWSGANGSGTVVMGGRILEQSETVVAGLAAKALGRLGLRNGGIKVKTLSKQPYTGPRPEFMPFSVKVR